jgi:YVTN family beta-propeller protein
MSRSSKRNPKRHEENDMNVRHRSLPILCTLSLFAAAPIMAKQKLYVLLSAEDRVAVVDGVGHEVLRSITVGKEPHGIAAPRSQDVLYISAEGANTLTVVDAITDQVVKQYPILGRRPNEIEVTGDGRTLLIPALGDGVYEVFDTEEEKIVARIPTDGFPHNTAVSPDGRYAYLAPMDRGPYELERIRELDLPLSLNEKIYVVDIATRSTVGSIPLPDAPRPIVIHPNGKRLFVNRDGLMGFEVVDLEERRVIATARYVLNEEEEATPSRSHGIGVTPDGREVWSTDINNGTVHVFDVTRDEPQHLAKLQTGRTPLWLTISPDGKLVYVANTADDSVSVFEVATRREKTRIQLDKGSAPKRMLVLDVPEAQRTDSTAALP